MLDIKEFEDIAKKEGKASLFIAENVYSIEYVDGKLIYKRGDYPTTRQQINECLTGGLS